MRIITSLVLAAVILTLPVTVTAAPAQQSPVDIKTLAITKTDLQRGFEVVPDRTVAEDRADGVAVYDVTFARERSAENVASGPFEVRSGVARTAQVEDAVLQLDSTKDAFLGEGWAETAVPALGDETLGLSQTTNGDGGPVAHYSYLFRKGSYILMIGIRGRPEATKLADAVGLAVIVSGRLDKALGTATAGAAQTGASTNQQSTGERVKVVGADGGSVNMRAESSTSAAVVAEVPEGTTLDIVGQNRDSEGRTWRNVRTSGNQTGWIASTFLETIVPPPPAASPSPSPSPAPAEQPAEGAAVPPPAEEPAAGTPVEPAPSPSPAPAPEADLSFRGDGNGLVVEATMRTKNLSSGKQQVKIKVTRNGGGVSDVFVNLTARLDAKRFHTMKLDRTNGEGFTEIEWDMEGPAGPYELIVEARTSETGPPTTAKGNFRWK